MNSKAAHKLKLLLQCEEIQEDCSGRWLLQQFSTTNENSCTLVEFALYFLNNLRQHTENHLKSNAFEVSKCRIPIRGSSMDRSTIDVQRSNKTSLEEFGCITPRLCTSADRISFSQMLSTNSTPNKHNLLMNSRRISNIPSSAKSPLGSSRCLGDFIIMNSQSANSRLNKKKALQQQQQQIAESGKLGVENPKKRVVPTTLSRKNESQSTSVFGGESSFSSENNMANVVHEEIEDKEQCEILAARKTLKLNPDEITEQVLKSSLSSPTSATRAAEFVEDKYFEPMQSRELVLDFESLKNNTQLQKLSNLYSTLIDLNLTTNVLNEISLLVNLLNATSSIVNTNSSSDICHNLKKLTLQDTEALACELPMKQLENLSGAVYFAYMTLIKQKHTIALLDHKSMSVVLNSDRWHYLPEDVKAYLKKVYHCKQKLGSHKNSNDIVESYEPKQFANVYFQVDQNSRQFFSSQQEFANFRAQRDHFYKILNIWELNHLNPNWSFSNEVAPRIKDIFDVSESPINMAHFAKLFVSQLLISSTNSTSPDDIGIEVDLLKFNKLTQRLITPSSFSMDYQFPHTQSFFRDFIAEARSLAFAEQLKMELYSELINLNDSSFDQICINSLKEDEAGKNDSPFHRYAGCGEQYVVKKKLMASMLVLAKFLGFAIALPFVNPINNNGNRGDMLLMPVSIEKKQMLLRNSMQPTFNTTKILEDSLMGGKLLITLPWMVQYLGMLDRVTLQLDNYEKTLRLVFALYGSLGWCIDQSNTFSFIIRVCLGWLFENKQIISEQYLAFSGLCHTYNAEPPSELQFVRTWLQAESLQSFDLNPMLEDLLHVACPFLAAFRVSIMPAKYAQTKYASRSGRFRYVTPRLSDLSSPAPSNKAVFLFAANQQTATSQKRLVQAFLHAQTASTRQLISFCIERCYRSAVKDGHYRILVPSKSDADTLVNKIESFDYYKVFEEIESIYSSAQEKASQHWNTSVPGRLKERIQKALEAFLPAETNPVLQETYFMIIKHEAAQKVNDWFNVNMQKNKFYCNDFDELVTKVCTANRNKTYMGSSDLKITRSFPSLSQLLDGLQQWLHCTSVQFDVLSDNFAPLTKLLKLLREAFENVLPALFFHVVGSSTVQLTQHLIDRHTQYVTNELIEAACNLWLHPKMQAALKMTTKKDNELEETRYSENTVPSIYESFITIPFIESLGTRRLCFDRLAQVLITMIKKHVITVDYTNELLVPIFKHDWHPTILSEISEMLRFIAKETTLLCSEGSYISDDEDGNDGNKKSSLFMEMLADFSRDAEFL